MFGLEPRGLGWVSDRPRGVLDFGNLFFSAESMFWHVLLCVREGLSRTRSVIMWGWEFFFANANWGGIYPSQTRPSHREREAPGEGWSFLHREREQRLANASNVSRTRATSRECEQRLANAKARPRNHCECELGIANTKAWHPVPFANAIVASQTRCTLSLNA